MFFNSCFYSNNKTGRFCTISTLCFLISHLWQQVYRKLVLFQGVKSWKQVILLFFCSDVQCSTVSFNPTSHISRSYYLLLFRDENIFLSVSYNSKRGERESEIVKFLDDFKNSLNLSKVWSILCYELKYLISMCKELGRNFDVLSLFSLRIF